MEEPIFNISKISRELNIPKHTLRFWEREFAGLLSPSRTHGGQRRYTRENRAIIEKIKALRESGASLSEIREALKDRSARASGPGDRIDILADRVAQVVKTEVINFLVEEGAKK
jgi:UDP-N-acetylglucosamine 4,6-dehydratase/5-epimerase